jgi:pyrimidine-nucleoside phosphorylase
MDGYAIVESFRRLDAGETLTESICTSISRARPPDYQLAALVVRLRDRPRSPPEEALLNWIYKETPSVAAIVAEVFEGPLQDSQGTLVAACDNEDLVLLRRIQRKQDIGLQLFGRFIQRYVKGDIPEVVAAFMLALVYKEGLNDPDITALTMAMTGSGATVDYRDYSENRGRRMLRRYPTGGVSEKVALILPSVCIALSDTLPLLTTTVVGRALGFTGGTWDKLKVVPGFTFPAPGSETEDVLSKCNAVMCTTGDLVNPADRELYLLRSLTSTITSDALIVSSIASKHLALPPHRMLLDICFGPGAFLQTKAYAERIAAKLTAVLNGGGVECSNVFTDTSQPAGTGVGNVLEVAEALAVMGAPNSLIDWDTRAIQRQRDIVVSQTTLLLCSEFKHLSSENLKSEVLTLFSSGRVLAAFYTLLIAHSVNQVDAENLCATPATLIEKLRGVPVLSRMDGKLTGLNQVRLGNLVNFKLAPRFAVESAPGQNRSGLRLTKQISDLVTSGEPLCVVYTQSDEPVKLTEELEEELVSCFGLSATTRV